MIFLTLYNLHCIKDILLLRYLLFSPEVLNLSFNKQQNDKVQTFPWVLIYSQKYHLEYPYRRKWDTLCMWLLERTHCSSQPKFCSVKLQILWNKLKKKKWAISLQLIWSVVWYSMKGGNKKNRKRFCFWLSNRYRSVADVCTHREGERHAHATLTLFHHVFTDETSKQQKSVKKQEKMALAIQWLLFGMYSSCKWPCIKAVWDRGLFICNLLLSICFVLQRTTLRGEEKDLGHGNGDAL